MSRLDRVKQSRQNKLQTLRSLGIDPFPQKSNRTHTASEARKKEGLEVTVAGRLMAWRGHGKIQFADLVDQSGKIQLVLKADDLSREEFDRLELLDLGDSIEASGVTFTTEAGESSVRVKSFRLLTKSLRPLPASWYGLKDVEDRYRQRYLDLLFNDQVKQTFVTRTRIVSLLREFFDRRGFFEVETPVLQPIYGGATAKPFVTHHNALDRDFYLRIADELYLKRLIVGGFEKVYEIGHDFRNEGISRSHNPEFTQAEFYWAYATYEDLMELTEELVTTIIRAIKGTLVVQYPGKPYDFTRPWQRLPYQEAIAKYTGIDIVKVGNEKLLVSEIRKKKLELDLKGVIGYAAVLDALYKKMVREHLGGPAFLIDYPYEMKPLAKRIADQPGKTGSFQLLVAGEEWVNAYNELNDPIDQRARWEEEMALAKKGLLEYQMIDEDYIRALEYGMPPTAGWGLGVDRLVAFITDSPSIKDVILFPTLKPEGQPSRNR